MVIKYDVSDTKDIEELKSKVVTFFKGYDIHGVNNILVTKSGEKIILSPEDNSLASLVGKFGGDIATLIEATSLFVEFEYGNQIYILNFTSASYETLSGTPCHDWRYLVEDSKQLAEFEELKTKLVDNYEFGCSGELLVAPSQIGVTIKPRVSDLTYVRLLSDRPEGLYLISASSDRIQFQMNKVVEGAQSVTQNLIVLFKENHNTPIKPYPT